MAGFEQQDDFVTQEEGLSRRRKLLDAMMQKNLNTPITGRGAAPVGQALLQVLASYIGSKNEEKLQTEAAEISGKRGADLQTKLSSYMDQRQGRPGDVMSDQDAANLMQNDVAPTLAEPVKANPREAVIKAMASKHPELQAIGKMDLAAQLAGQKKSFDDKVMPDGTIVRVTDDGTVKPLGNFAKKPDQWSEPFLMKGTDGKPLMVKRNLTTNEVDVVDKAPKVTANASANAKTVSGEGESEFAKALGKDVAGEFKLARQNAQNAYKAQSFVNQMQKLEESGIFTGPTANVATTLGAVAQTLGIPVDEKKLANSQAFQQQFAAQVANVLTSGGGIGRSMTDADRKAFEASLPTMIMTPEGRARVYQMIQGQAEQDIQRAKSFQEQLISNPAYQGSAGLLTINPVDSAPIGASGGVVPPGAAPVQVPGAKPRVTNW